MANQSVSKGTTAEVVRRTRIQEVMFDDFFGKKLSGEGFTIEQIAGEYRISSNPIDTPPSALEDSSRRMLDALGRGENPAS
jgi:hypothetical protein